MSQRIVSKRRGTLRRKRREISNKKIVALLLQGYENPGIAKELRMKLRTVKNRFNWMYKRSGITDGIKRVRLAVMMYEKGQSRRATPATQSTGGGLYGDRTLTSREWKVVELVASGLKNKEAGAVMHTTEHVIKNYLRVVYDKSGMWNRVELAMWYMARRQASL
jgi:DNA-binding NarL/FixJ family response regulator